MKRFICLSYVFYNVFCPLLLAHGDHHHHHGHEAEEEFHWTQEKTQNADIHVQVAGPGVIKNYIQVSGKITMHPEHVALVIPKVTGSVYTICKNLGDCVEKGEVLALIESKEIAEIKAHYLAAEKKYQVRRFIMEQEEALQGISAKQDYLQAKLAAEEAFLDLQVVLQSLYALGMNHHDITKIKEQDSQDLRFYELKSPLKGKILQKDLTLGELSDHTSKAFTVGNFEKVMVEVQIPQNGIDLMKEGLPADVLSVLGKTANVNICHLSQAINEETRTATALAVVNNNAEQWTPGEFVTVFVQTDVMQAPVVVSRDALQTIKGQECIFVQTGSEFAPCVVKLGKMDRENVEIVSGLKPGVGYAACNTFCLKAEYEKGEAEHTH